MRFVCSQCNWCACGMHCVCSMCALSLHSALRWAVAREAVIQLEHDLDANTSPRQSVAHRERAPEREEGAWGGDALRVHRCWIARCFARFACEGWKHCADFAHQKKVCKVCMPIFCRLAHSGQVCIVSQMHTFSEKVCTKSAQRLTKSAKYARGLHQVCIPTGGFCGENPRLVKMQIWCKLFAHLSRLVTDTMQTIIHVWIWHTFLFSCAKCAQGKQWHTDAHFMQTYADL